MKIEAQWSEGTSALKKGKFVSQERTGNQRIFNRILDFESVRCPSTAEFGRLGHQILDEINPGHAGRHEPDPQGNDTQEMTHSARHQAPFTEPVRSGWALPLLLSLYWMNGRLTMFSAK